MTALPHPAFPEAPAARHRRLVVRLLALVAAAFAFGFALVPLYDVFCEATGLNGKTAGRGGFGINGLLGASDPVSRVDTTRLVNLSFTGTVMPGLGWDMRPLAVSLDVHPGELQTVKYLVRNLTDRPLAGQAVPSVSPGQAAQHFQKLDCFCFSQQTLGPGEAREMPLTFIVRPEIGRDIASITLSYAFYPVDESTARREAP